MSADTGTDTNIVADVDRALVRHALARLDPRIVLRGTRRTGRPARAFTDAVTIPARDEAARLEAAIAALARAVRSARASTLAVLVVNDSRDGSAAIAAAAASRHGLDALVLDIALPPAGGVGLARRVGCHVATTLHPSVSRLHTSDADARVERRWLARAIAALASVDAVCGRVDGMREEARALPASLEAPQALQHRYLQLMLRSEAWLDPDPHNPWPHHGRACGASLSLRRDPYERVGGFAAARSGEDTELIARVRAAGGTVRFADEVRVQASCRLDGRAPDGMAEAIRRRVADPDSPADAQLEPALTHLLRVRSRVRVRRAFARGEPFDDALRPLRLEPETLAAALGDGTFGFGHLWTTMERLSPRLVRRPLRPSELPAECAVLERALDTFMSGHDEASPPIRIRPDAAIEERVAQAAATRPAPRRPTAN